MDIWIRALMAMNVFIYRLTRGRLGSKMAGQSVLLLHTVGHKSGAAYTTPINYYRDGEAYVVIASKGSLKCVNFVPNMAREKSGTCK